MPLSCLPLIPFALKMASAQRMSSAVRATVVHLRQTLPSRPGRPDAGSGDAVKI